MSTTSPSPIGWPSVRPPTRSRASSTATSVPAATRSRAAVSPESPAPTIATSTSRDSSTGADYSASGGHGAEVRAVRLVEPAAEADERDRPDHERDPEEDEAVEEH